MRWPWQRKHSSDRLVCSWADQTLCYVLARQQAEGKWAVLKMGQEQQGSDTLTGFASRLQALGLKGLDAVFMLRASQYQFLQIDTPAVPPEELRSAARYQIRDMLQSHVDDVTIDVVRVGDDAHQANNGHSFVVAAPNVVVRAALVMAAAMDGRVSVIDVQELAQRNLQTALAQRDGQPERANAALVLVPGQQALLTISANDELFYTRRFDVPEGFLTSVWGQGVAVVAPVDGFTPVEEYVPAYGAGDVSFDNDFAPAQALPLQASAPSRADDEKAQRLVVEVQRSLDVWDRTWSSLPLNRLRVYAGERTVELAQWLTQQLGQSVTGLELGALFPGFDDAPAAQQAQCLPLLGVLLRNEGKRS
jgi:MSHA biogenesis protein MshI